MIDVAASPSLFQNTVLRSLNSESLDRLQLRPVTVQPGQLIVAAGDCARSVLFLESGSVAVSIPLADGSLIETAMLGWRSVVGAAALLRIEGAGHQIVGRSPAYGFVCSLKNARREFALSGQFHDLALGCLHAQLLQTSQIAACNGRHDAEQRICRWLLRYQDESGKEQIHVTHEILGEALSIRRPTVTLALDLLRNQGFIGYRRGQISLLNRSMLEAHACECYRVLRRALTPDSRPQCSSPHRQISPSMPFSENGTEFLLQRDRSTKIERRLNCYLQ